MSLYRNDLIATAMIIDMYRTMRVPFPLDMYKRYNKRQIKKIHKKYFKEVFENTLSIEEARQCSKT